MRTTVRLHDSLLERAKREAARRGTTLTRLIEQGLQMVLARPGGTRLRSRISLPVCRRGGGTLPEVDLDNSVATLDRLEGRE